MFDFPVSIVVPVLNEENSIIPLYQNLINIQDKYVKNMEIIFIDDGSTDNSRQIIEDIAKKDKRVVSIALNNNYGQTIAIAAGIESSNGEIIITIDSDLQNDPNDIPQLLDKIVEGYDVVSGWRKKRVDPLFSRLIPSKIANSIVSFLTGIKLHDFGCTLKAYKKEYIKNISIHGEMHRFLPAYCAWQGAKIIEVKVNHFKRKHGKSKYGFGSRTFKVILDLLVIKFILSYITKPIYVFGGIAMFSFVIGAVINAFVVWRKFYNNTEWLSPLFFIGSMFWFLSIICFLLGLLAEILVRFYFETRYYPIYKIRSKVNLK